MTRFNIVFEDGTACGRFADDADTLIAEISEEFPGRKIVSIIQALDSTGDED